MQADMIRQKIKKLLSETDKPAPATAPRSRWREAAFILMALALIVQALLLASVTSARQPLYLGMDPYGNKVVAPTDRPLTGRIYGFMSYEPGTQVIPAQEELKERTGVKFPF
ncbi:MAG: hypothetical protein AB1560_02105 [Pseudomonadota bacterium]